MRTEDERDSEDTSERPAPARMSRRTAVMLTAVGACAAGLGAYAAIGLGRRAAPPPNLPGLLWPDPKRLEPFALLDHDAKPFDVARLEGHWNLLFFGYTFCPDVCPTTLQVLKSADAKMAQSGAAAGDLGGEMQYVFVSVDPERDTPEQLEAYMSFFGPRFVGVTGEPDAVAALARQVGVVYARGEDVDGGGYLVDHTATILVVDPRARLVGLLHAPHRVEALAGEFGDIRAFVSSEG